MSWGALTVSAIPSICISSSQLREDRLMNAKSITVTTVVVVALGALAYMQLPEGGPDTMSGMDHMAPANDALNAKAIA